MQTSIIKRPVITEKSLALANARNIYTFEVDRLATKDQVEKAIESIYSVNVLAVNTVKMQRATKLTGKKRLKTVTAKSKKALVTLKAGQTIELFDLGGK